MKVTPLEKVIKLLESWNSQELIKLQSWLSTRIEEVKSLEEKLELLPVKSGREVFDIRQSNSIVYRQETVRCGKKNCRTCPHGPYWYGYQRTKGKMVSFYVGKELPNRLM